MSSLDAPKKEKSLRFSRALGAYRKGASDGQDFRVSIGGKSSSSLMCSSAMRFDEHATNKSSMSSSGTV